MTFSSQIIPKELLKFRLDKQLGRLKQVIEAEETGSSSKEEDEDKFQLYQRVLSWFIMGRLAKSEYDGILENILITTELIGKNKIELKYSGWFINMYCLELHNRIIELLRAIYCDSSSNFIANEINYNSSNSNLNSFLNSFEFDLLPPDERRELEEVEEDIMVDTEDSAKDTKYTADDNNDDIQTDIQAKDSHPQFINSYLKICKFNTSIENLGLTTSEEALISEAMRNPIHDIASIEKDILIPGINYKKGFDINFDCGNRSCTELKCLPDQNLMKSRFCKIAASTHDENFLTPTISDSIAILACKSLEDYMKNLLENVATIKFGHQPLLRPPISYIFPNFSEDQNNEILIGKRGGGDYNQKDKKVTEKDLNLLFKLKPWLLGDMESDLLIELFK